MSEAIATRPSLPWRIVATIGVVSLSMFASFGVTRAWRGKAGHTSPRPATTRNAADSSPRIPFPSGRYLVAFVLVSSKCGFCTEPWARKALGEVRDSLQRTQGKTFAHTSVIGVAIDDDLQAGVRYLQGFRGRRTSFDELSIGGSWLNEIVTSLVWRDGLATAEVPQVVLVERRVDARGYPGNIAVRRDSMLLRVVGREDVIAWVNAGTPLAFRPIPRTGVTRPPP